MIQHSRTALSQVAPCHWFQYWRLHLGLSFPLAVVTLLLALSAGCSSLQTEYGYSQDAKGKKSISGFGVLRQFYRHEGWKDRSVNRLSERINNMDALVWTPAADTTPTLEVTEWFDEWLARGNKTLVYVIRDYETDARYWTAASKLAAPEQRLEYRRRAARAQMAAKKKRLAQPAIISNGWFTAYALEPPSQTTSLSGEWADDVGEFAKPYVIGYGLRAYDAAKDMTSGLTPPIVTPGFSMQTSGTTSVSVDFASLLETGDGKTIVGRVTSDEWPKSQIIVVSGGSMVNNYGLLEGSSRSLASNLVAASKEVTASEFPKVCFLYSNESDVNISDLAEDANSPSGMEMLTVWPISLLTIHLAILGLVICLMLLPIFGRPRRIRPRSSTDFSDHIQAVASAMAKTNGEQYARVRISEYMVRVRREMEGPWVIPPASLPQPTPIPQTQPANEVESV